MCGASSQSGTQARHSIECDMYFSEQAISIHQWPYSPLLGHGLFFSLVIYFKQSVGLLGRGSARLKATTYTQDNTNTELTFTVQTSMSWVGFEPTKAVHALDRATTVFGEQSVLRTVITLSEIGCALNEKMPFLEYTVKKCKFSLINGEK
jgi:hypothetical protein